MMAWWLRMVFGEFPASFMAPYSTSRFLADRRLSRTLPSRGRMVCLICAR